MVAVAREVLRRRDAETVEAVDRPEYVGALRMEVEHPRVGIRVEPVVAEQPVGDRPEGRLQEIDLLAERVVEVEDDDLATEVRRIRRHRSAA